MTKSIEKIRYEPDTVSPPGETIAELLKERGISQSELARRMGRPIKTINEIIHGKAAITPETSLQLERVFGVPAYYWIDHEARYQSSLAQQNEESQITNWYPWLDFMPVSALKKQGILPDVPNRGHTNKKLLVRSLLSFFSVSTPDEWQSVYGNLQVAYRQSMPKQSDTYARAAWLRLGELQVERSSREQYNEQHFLTILQDIRQLTVQPLDYFEPNLRAQCAESGVVLALVPAIKGARVSGAARWINGHPLIQLSLYGKTNDRFWFTFYHEACHILKHSRRRIYVDEWDDDAITEMEMEADRFAAEILIPPKYNNDLLRLTSRQEVERFSRETEIHPGIVVGRLQHDGIIEQSWMNDLKVKYNWTS